MPKYKDLIAEFEYAYARHVKTERALEFKWTIRRATEDAGRLFTEYKPALIARLRPAGYGIQNDGSHFHIRMGMDLMHEPYDFDVKLGQLRAVELEKLAALKAQIELWEGGFRNDLPTQAELDEL